MVCKMLTQEEREDWARIVAGIDRKKIEAWIVELHGSQVHSFDWIDDAEELPYVSFMDGTHCCGISLCEPPSWLTYRIMKQ